MTDEVRFVDLIASGYEWICPDCEHYQRIIAITETVTCEKCGEKFTVDEIHHAYD